MRAGGRTYIMGLGPSILHICTLTIFKFEGIFLVYHIEWLLGHKTAPWVKCTSSHKIDSLAYINY